MQHTIKVKAIRIDGKKNQASSLIGKITWQHGEEVNAFDDAYKLFAQDWITAEECVDIQRAIFFKSGLSDLRMLPTWKGGPEE